MRCYSTGSLPDDFSFSQILNTFRASAFTGVELVLTPDMLAQARDENYWRGIHSEFARAGLSFRNIHLGAPFLLGPEAHCPGLGSLDPKQRGRKISAVQAAVAIAYYLGSPHVTVTTGLPDGADATVDGAGTEDAATEEARMEALDFSLREIIAFKESFLEQQNIPNDSIVILIEQEPEHVIHTTDQLLELCKKFTGNVYANFDIGHSHVLAEDIGACLKTLGPYLKNIHLEDILGRVHQHKLFGDGDLDFDTVFASLHAIGYRGDFTPDLYPFKDEYEKVMQISENFLKDRGIF